MMEVLLLDLTTNLKMFWVGIKSIINSDMLHLLTQLLELNFHYRILWQNEFYLRIKMLRWYKEEINSLLLSSQQVLFAPGLSHHAKATVKYWFVIVLRVAWGLNFYRANRVFHIVFCVLWRFRWSSCTGFLAKYD